MGIVKAGTLRHRLRLQSATKASDGMGGYTTTHSTDCTIWGAVWPQKGTEYVQHMLTQGEVIIKIRIRYRSGVVIGKRFQTVADSAIYNIKSVINWENRNVYLDCVCVQEV
jgi:SPP1 family predicted phage head-tail adaptor